MELLCLPQIKIQPPSSDAANLGAQWRHRPGSHACHMGHKVDACNTGSWPGSGAGKPLDLGLFSGGIKSPLITSANTIYNNFTCPLSSHTADTGLGLIFVFENILFQAALKQLSFIVRSENAVRFAFLCL